MTDHLYKRRRPFSYGDCVVCGLPLEDYDLAGRRKPHQCPDEVLELFEEAERIGEMLDDPEGPTVEELFPRGRGLERFHAYGLFLEYQ